MSTPPSINLKIDSGATHNFYEIGSTNLPQQPTYNYNPAVQVILTNGSSMVSSITTHIPITSLPPSAKKSHGFNHLASESIFSVGKAFDHNCTKVFDNKYVKIFKSTEVNITALSSPIIQGYSNTPSQPLHSVSLPTYLLSAHKENASINVSLIQYRIDFYHGALFSPKMSSWCKAIKNGFLQY